MGKTWTGKRGQSPGNGKTGTVTGKRENGDSHRFPCIVFHGRHRLSQADTGRPNGGRTAITGEWATPTRARALVTLIIIYAMDILGNMTTLNRKNSGVNANETRTHNATSELTARTIAAESARYWVNENFADNDAQQRAAADLARIIHVARPPSADARSGCSAEGG